MMMASLVYFYRGAITPTSFERLDSGQLIALNEYRTLVIEESNKQ